MSASDLQLETLTTEQQGRVLVVRVDDPPFNYMTARMQRDLDALTRAVDVDESVGAVVLTGGPEGRFITHFDIAEILAAAERAGRGASSGVMRNVMRALEVAQRVPGATEAIESSPISGLLNVSRFNEVVLRIMRSPAVYIAAINGPCGGGGLEMSVCFDVRYVADDGAGFMLPELLIGLTTTVGGQRLVQLMGPARALELLLEGRMYSALEGLDLGLVNQVVPKDALLEVAVDKAALYATRNRDTIAAQKRVFNEHALLSPAASLRAEGATNAAGVVSGVAPQALRAWVETQERHGGESTFLADLEPWRRGEAIDLTQEG